MESEKRYTMRASAVALPGKAHLAAGCPCEDIIIMHESAGFCFYGLADGQSRKKHCKEGAEISLSAAAEYISASGIDSWHCEPYQHRLQHGLVKNIQTALRREAAACSCDLLEFGSTLAALAVEPCSGRYVLVHLGDGRVVGICSTGKARDLSPPENGLCLNQAWLTASPDAEKHLRGYVGSIANYRRIIIMSDGADGMFRNERQRRKLAELPAGEECRHALELIAANRSDDDFGCIMIDIHKEANRCKNLKTASIGDAVL